MKLSDLIQEAQKAIATHGDGAVLVTVEGATWEINSLYRANPDRWDLKEQHEKAEAMPLILIDADEGMYRREFEHPADRPAGEAPLEEEAD